MRMCQCKFIICKSHIALMADIDTEIGHAYGVPPGMWEISELSAQFCCELKGPLKISAVSLKNISRHCHMYPCGTNFPLMKNR